MGWVVDFIIDFFWVGFVLHFSDGKPSWVFALLALSPLIALAIVAGILFLAFQN